MVTGTMEDWLLPKCEGHSSLIVKRPLYSRFNQFRNRVDAAASENWDGPGGMVTTMFLHNGMRDVSSRLAKHVDTLLLRAALPAPLA